MLCWESLVIMFVLLSLSWWSIYPHLTKGRTTKTATIMKTAVSQDKAPTQLSHWQAETLLVLVKAVLWQHLLTKLLLVRTYNSWVYFSYMFHYLCRFWYQVPSPFYYVFSKKWFSSATFHWYLDLVNLILDVYSWQVTITASLCLDTSSSQRAVFQCSESADNEQSVASKLFTDVEQCALMHYKSKGYPKGVHAEGSSYTFIFSLLFWDIIFMDVPNVFVGPYQVISLY